MSNKPRPLPPDQAQRERALDPRRSILVQAPAGSGKTDLLTRRFLRLLTEIEEPEQVVAITFTKAAAAEMHHRIISELEKASSHPVNSDEEFSMASLAHRALKHSEALGWNLLKIPAQLRISTIDSFCRELAIQQPILSGLGGGLELSENPSEMYRRAARRTLKQIGNPAAAELSHAIESLLIWRDNNWKDVEDQLVSMLQQRDRWMQEFVLDREPDWEQLRSQLERPFVRAVKHSLDHLSSLLNAIPNACSEAHMLAQFACEQTGLHRDLAELAQFPCGPFDDVEQLEEARSAYACLADMLLTDAGDFRKRITVVNGFPNDRKPEKQRMEELIRALQEIPNLRVSLSGIRSLPSARYNEDDWLIVRACFQLLRHAAGELKVAFAEAGLVDFVEVAQLAQRILEGEDGLPTDAGIAIADRIHHLLVDEFQDTSRRQHRLIASLVSAWPDTTGRTVFVVGDPMQSIYFFRDADAELFPRVRIRGLELAGGAPFTFNFVPLSANFRTAPQLVEDNNQTFSSVFAADDGSGIHYAPSIPARVPSDEAQNVFDLHLTFVPQLSSSTNSGPDALRVKQEILQTRGEARLRQTSEIVDLIRSRLPEIDRARQKNEKYRIAVLGRTRSVLAFIADALRNAGIPFRAVDLENLADRPEVLDALAIARALLSAEDRIAWLGLLRAPWSGLSLEDLHMLTSGDDPELMSRPIPLLLEERAHLLSTYGQRIVRRVQRAVNNGHTMRTHHPDIALGTWIRQVWEGLGGAACVDASALENLELLWTCFDELRNGEADLLGDGLQAALAKLTALPDPATSSDYGVQLMTIHKSKGLEFEVVIVPELQAGSGRTSVRMLSWLERGLAEPDEIDATTEFLIAPQQRKGSERGSAKEWVDRTYREREQQEMRRILYVAATRAREELHIFARPEFKEKDGERTLCNPTASLLSTAWSAFEHELQARFAAWLSETSSTVAELAAEAQILTLPTSASGTEPKPAILRRLPDAYDVPESPLLRAGRSESRISASASMPYVRHEGSIQSRALGNAVHFLLENYADAPRESSSSSVFSALLPRIASSARSSGIPADEAQRIASEAIDIVHQALNDPTLQWILAQHSASATEACWTGLVHGDIRTVRIDRVFRAGDRPQTAGQDCWWIVDYKTAHPEFTDSAATLQQLRTQFAPQLELYAQILRNLQSEDIPVRAGLYYPRMRLFDWWEI